MMNLSDVVELKRPYLKSSEVAKIFNVDHSTVFLWVKKRKLRPIKTPGGNFRFARAEVERLFREMSGRKEEKRKSPRFMVNFPVMLAVGQNGHSEVQDGVINDLSSEGLGVLIQSQGILANRLLKGEVKQLFVKPSGNLLLRDSLLGEVRHAHALNDTQIALGLLVTN